MSSTVPVLSNLSKVERLEKLRERREKQPEEIDDGKLRAGSPMHYRCISCGWYIIIPENWITRAELCDECDALKKLGWLE